MIAAALALVATAGCGSEHDADARGGPAGSPPVARDPLLAAPLPAGAARIDGNQFHVDVAAQPGCAAGADCAVFADLTATGGFKVNTEYPFKFVASPGAAIAPAATFAPTAVQHGRLILRFRRPSAEPVRVAGDFKLSVCNADRCLIEVAPLVVVVP